MPNNIKMNPQNNSKQLHKEYTQDTIQRHILSIRGQQVIMDADFAEFYQVKTLHRQSKYIFSEESNMSTKLSFYKITDELLYG